MLGWNNILHNKNLGIYNKIFNKKSIYTYNYLNTDALPELQTGFIYKWNIRAWGTGITKKRILKKVNQEEIQQLINRLYAEEIPGEDSASRFFRVAYTLEQKHYLGEALYYYQLASNADHRNIMIRDRFTRFRNEYYLPI